MRIEKAVFQGWYVDVWLVFYKPNTLVGYRPLAAVLQVGVNHQ